MEEENEYFFDPYIQLHGTFDAQALKIWETIRLSPKERADLRTLHYDIRKILQEIWPGCDVKVFGSVVTGLAFKNCDMDFFIKLPEHCEDDTYNCLIMTEARVAWKESAFEYVSTAHLAKVPFITLKHVETNRNCDITFSNSIALETNKLVRYLLRLDSRAFKLAILIKYWTKIYKLTITKQLSNHATTLLVIFFLQQKKILPSVAALQKNAFIIMTEGWNTNFEQVTHECNNAESLYKLLGDFFVYYSNFNFEDFVVCPYLGYPVQRHTFVNPLLLPTEFKLYKERVRRGCASFKLTSALCVQDTLEHNRNCTEYVNEPLASKLDNCFKHATTCYKNSSSFGFLRNLTLKASRNPSPAYSTVNRLQEYYLTDYQVPAPQEGRSWKFYFCISICLFTFYTFLIKRSSV